MNQHWFVPFTNQHWLVTVHLLFLTECRILKNSDQIFLNLYLLCICKKKQRRISLHQFSKIEQMVNESKYIHNILMGILEDPKFWQEKYMTLKLDLVKCGRTCVVCDQLKNARTHAHRTHIFKAFSHAHAHVRPHIARVRARTHLRNSRLAKNII